MKASPATPRRNVSRQVGAELDGKPTPLPKLQLSLVLYLQLAEPITANVILPFIVQFILETGVTGGDVTKVGYYAGLVESIFFFTQALTVLQWGRLSDRIGRRPVLLSGLSFLGVSVICFGLSHTFWGILCSRAIAGVFNGNAGVLKCMIAELTDETNMAQGFAWISIVWAIGNVIAPFIGGSLQHPYDRFGGMFQHFEFWKRNPYFLPCFIAALCPISAFILASTLLKETAPSVTNNRAVTKATTKPHVISDMDSSPETVSIATDRTPLISGQKTSSNSMRDLLTPRILRALINYNALAVIEISFVVLRPLFLSTPIAHGGLGMSPFVIGTCLSVTAVFNGVINVVFFVPINRWLGSRKILAIANTALAGCFLLFPLMNALARMRGGLWWGVWIAFAVQLGLATFAPMGYSCTFIYLRSAASPSALGATNGIAQTTVSLMRGIGPVITTSLFALSIERNMLGGALVYVLLTIAALFAVMATGILPPTPWSQGDL